MANEQYIDGAGNIALQHIEQSTIDIHQYIGKSLEYKQLEERLSELKDMLAVFASDPVKKQDYTKKITAQEKMIEAFKADVLRLAGTFDQIELYSENLVLARQLFDEGKFREANTILSVSDLQEEQDHLLQKKERTEKALRNNANAFLVKAQSTALDFENPERFALACEYFESSLAADKNTDNLQAYIEFLSRHNKQSKAFPYAKEAVAIARNGDQYVLAKSLYQLGVIYYDWKELGEAQKAWREGLKIMLEIYETDKTRYFLQFMLLLDAMGVINSYIGKWKEAEESYTIQVKLYESAVRSDPDKYSFYLANARYKLLITKAELHPFNEISQEITMFLDDVRQQEIGRMDLLPMLLNFLLLFHGNGQYDTALSLSDESLGICEQRIKTDPEIMLPMMGQALNHRASLMLAMDNLPAALETYKKAEAIFEQLVKDEPGEFTPLYARSLSGLGRCLLNSGDIATGEVKINAALEIRRKLYAKNNYLFRDDLAQSVKDHALLQFKQEQYEEAMTGYLEAETLYRKLLEQHPEKYKKDIADCLFYIAQCYAFREEDDINKAAEYFEHCAEIRRQLAADDPKKNFLSFGTCLYNLGVIFTRYQPDRTKALKSLREIIDKYNQYGFDEKEGLLFDLITDTAVLLIIWDKRDKGEIE